ncbi:transmembrane and coiled-coil domain-containing protein 4-like [Phoenix dactylifera]|uniref:Transmembrane and coiled-coil domain-containing protein 4-like n=1 Tax=Phoenix dactylifera TaxID=42345 RepID=A0A8B8ZKM0_PHODC|nr:transmembrane and coiled-coil domain-containing protein 4-like [Phoenix dactylifera]
MTFSILTPDQRVAAGGLLALALRHAQLLQILPFGSSSFSIFTSADDGRSSSSSTTDKDGESSLPHHHRHHHKIHKSGGLLRPVFELLDIESMDWPGLREMVAHMKGDGKEGDSHSSQLWTHESHGLLRPVFRFLEIDSKAWPVLEKAAVSSPAREQVVMFLKTIFDDEEACSERSNQEFALTEAVDYMVKDLQTSSASAEAVKKHNKHKDKYHERITSDVMCRISEVTCKPYEIFEMTKLESLFSREEAHSQSNNEHGEKSFLEDILVKHQRKVVVLYELLSACVADIPQECKKPSQHRKGYDARHRVALQLLAKWLNVEWIKMEAMEIMVACSAMTAAKEVQSEECESTDNSWSGWKRSGIIGAAALAGGTLLAISGGLAAPAIASGFSALSPTLGTLVPAIGASGFAAAASAAGSAAGSIAVAASFGVAGAGLSGSKMARRIADIEEFEFIPMGENHNQGRLAVDIFVSGFIFEEEDFKRPWEEIEDNLERYALQWESKHLIAVSTAIQNWLTTKMTTELVKQGAMMTVLSTLVSALAWPTTLLSATDFIDSKWSIAIDRSDKAGKLLAEALLKGLQGNRPVTLVGFSLGARVIFKCLEHLAKSVDNEGLVQKVVLLGAPISLKGEQWESARKMVAGRFVNVFSTNDWILGITFRASLMTQGLAGIQAINVPGIENVDVTDIIDGHSSYLWAASEILRKFDA